MSSEVIGERKSLMDKFIGGMEKSMRFIPSPNRAFLWLILFIAVIVNVNM